ncbi:hypothetical protein [Hoeflea prorocentri]|uniref:DUF4760 domain-containing protein n=1 Tax=Hoeflea prorocentri TaxID=1922333 RepID=A0A9X3UKG1_9HYPH|nr:hypothetical protein [Hoeflea prorocentri]MCY6380526.1 hypothetical protein [Hoeflea prorocentri]MDA5398326.1 hypothetical protein [Hoeflea prorocentri]
MKSSADSDELKRLSFKDKSDIVTSWLGVLSIIIAAVAFLYTYRGDLEDRRTAQQSASFEMFDLYTTSLVDEREAFYVARRKANDAVQHLANATHGSSGITDAIHKGRQEAFSDAVKENGRGAKIDLLVVFFDSLHACNSTQHCDEELSVALFGIESETIFEFLATHIQERRKVQPKYGDGMMKLRCQYLKRAQSDKNCG